MASGTAFATVVLGQAGNAFACRSAVRPLGVWMLRGNPGLVAGVGAERALIERDRVLWHTRTGVDWL